MDKKYAKIIIAISHTEVDKVFHYNIPVALADKIQEGMRVIVPFGKGNTQTEGYVLGFTDKTELEESQIKSVLSLTDEYPAITKQLFETAVWMKSKYYTTLNMCVQCILPPGLQPKIPLKDYIKKEKYLSRPDEIPLAEAASLKINSLQYKIYNYIAESGESPYIFIKNLFQSSDAPIQSLIKKKLLYQYEKIIEQPKTEINTQINFSKAPKLTLSQSNAVNKINYFIQNNIPKTILIHGVTGSGKTEVYLQLVKEAIRKGKDAIILVPEISLTPQTVNRIIDRFGSLAALTHSRMNPSERLACWQKARRGEIKIMIGPRSAVFTPFSNLGIIIIDEEHENTYKSENTPKYDTREVAYELTKQSGVLVLGSATPSVETYYKAATNEIELVTLKERVGTSQLPDMRIIDMRTELMMGNRSIFSTDLKNEIENNIQKKEQTILFLNRRGHSSFVSCRKCGFVVKCDNCSISYTYHKSYNLLMCHYCGKKIKNPETCPQCGSKYIKYFGVGTQKVQEELQKLYPDITVSRMDMDTTSKKNSHEQILKTFASGESQILIGTQMIAKGHDFPKVTLVGIICADMSLNAGDYSSAETTYQLITQVSGRAGRGELSGRVYVQTYNPEHYSIVHAKDQGYEKFYQEEIIIRRQMKYPPYSNFFVINFVGLDEKKIIIEAFKLLEILKYYNRKGNFDLIGPTPCFISKINKEYRWKLIIKCEEEERLKNYALYCMEKLKQTRELGGIMFNLSLNPRVIQ